MSKTAIIIIIVVILTGLGYGAYWYFIKGMPFACTEEAKLCPDGSYIGRTGPNCEFAECPDVTKDWLTYRNEEYGFEVKYPKDMSIMPEKKEDNGSTVIDIEKGTDYGLSFEIAISPNNTETIEQIAGKFNESGLQKFNINFLGLPAVKLAFKGSSQSPPSYFYFFSKNNNLFRISYIPNNIGDQILSTFKFIK